MPKSGNHCEFPAKLTFARASQRNAMIQETHKPFMHIWMVCRSDVQKKGAANEEFLTLHELAKHSFPHEFCFYEYRFRGTTPADY